jgi:tetratricopeptide (TPR) repeat protein
MRFAILGLAGAIVATPATAQKPTPASQCEDTAGKRFAVDVRIGGCSSAIKAAKRPGKSTAWAYNNRGFAWLEKEDLDRAMADFTEAIRLDPAYARAYHGRAIAWRRKGEFSRAMADLDYALSLDTSDAAAFYFRAQMRWHESRYPEARDDLGRAIALDRQNTEYRLSKARLEVLIGQFAEAAKDCAAVLQYDSRNLQAWECKGEAEVKAGHASAALESFREALELDPRSVRAGVGLGDAHLRLGSYREALDAYREASEKANHKDAQIIRSIAKAHTRLGSYFDAVLSYDVALNLDPKNRFLKLERAEALAKVWQFTQALEDLDAYVLAYPDRHGFRARAAVHEAYGDWRRALADITRYCEMEPDDADGWLQRGRLQGLLGEAAGALVDLEKAVRLAPDNPSPWRELTKEYGKQGKLGILLGRLDWQLAANPDDRRALERRKAINVTLDRHGAAIADIDLLIKAAATDRSSVRFYRLEKARLMMAAGREDDALREAEGIAGDAAAGQDGFTLQLKAILLFRSGREAEALAALSAAVAHVEEMAVRLQSYIPVEHHARAAERILADISARIAQTPDPELYKVRSQLMSDLGRIHEAADDRLKALELDPDGQFDSSVPRLLARAGRHDRALAMLDQQLRKLGLTEGSDDLRSVYHQARAAVHRAARDHTAEIEDLESALKAEPDNPALHVLLREAHAARGSLDSLIDIYRQELEQQPRFVSMLKWRSATLYAAGRVVHALADLARVLEIRPTDTDALDRRADILAEIGRYAEAVADRQRIVALAPGEVNGFARLASLHAAAGDRLRAEEALARARSIRPKSASMEHGALQLSAGDAGEALAEAENALRIITDFPEALELRGRARLELGNLAAARADFDHALRRMPEFRPALEGRALLHQRAGDRAAMIADARRALELLEQQWPNGYPAPASMMADRAFYLLLADAAADALPLIEQVVDANPGAVAHREVRGLVLAALGRREEAIADFRRVLARDDKRHRSRQALAKLTASAVPMNDAPARPADPPAPTQAPAVDDLPQTLAPQPPPADLPAQAQVPPADRSPQTGGGAAHEPAQAADAREQVDPADARPAASGMASLAPAACRIMDAERSSRMIKYYAASTACPFFKKQMEDTELFALLDSTGSMSGIPAALLGTMEEGNACMQIVMPFVRSKSYDWLKTDRSSFCSSVKSEIDSTAAIRSTFGQWGVY